MLGPVGGDLAAAVRDRAAYAAVLAERFDTS